MIKMTIKTIYLISQIDKDNHQWKLLRIWREIPLIGIEVKSYLYSPLILSMNGKGRPIGFEI